MWQTKLYNQHDPTSCSQFLTWYLYRVKHHSCCCSNELLDDGSWAVVGDSFSETDVSKRINPGWGGRWRGQVRGDLVAVGHAVRARTEGADPLRGKRLLLLRLRGECCRRHQLVELPCAGAVGFRQEEGALEVIQLVEMWLSVGEREPAFPAGSLVLTVVPSVSGLRDEQHDAVAGQEV